MRLPVLVVLAVLAGSCATGDPAGSPASTTEAPSASTAVAPSSTSTTTTTATPPSGVTAADLCAGAVPVEPAPEIDTDLLPETSGVVFSRAVEGRLYAHNDSGNLPRLYGIGPASTVDAVWTVDTGLLDWEDIAIAGTDLYLADTGDNLHLRPTVRVIGTPEPTGTAATLDDLTVWTFSYADRDGGPARPDVEALLVDTDGTEAVLISKGLDAPIDLYVLGLREGPADEPARLAPVGRLDLDDLVTGADLSVDGRVIAVRTPNQILLWDRPAGASIVDTLLDGAPCVAPSAPERQGEAIALHPDGRGYTTLSERESSTRNEFRLEGP